SVTGMASLTVNLSGFAVVHNYPGFDLLSAPASADPPDTDVAVGPDHIVETVNYSLVVLDKATGAWLSTQRLGDLFAPAGAPGGQFDPVVSYDEMAGRFVIAAAEVDGERSYLDFAVSNSSNPLEGFTEVQRIEVTEIGTGFYDGNPLWGDFTRLGW